MIQKNFHIIQEVVMFYQQIWWKYFKKQSKKLNYNFGKEEKKNNKTNIMIIIRKIN